MKRRLNTCTFYSGKTYKSAVTFLIILMKTQRNHTKNSNAPRLDLGAILFHFGILLVPFWSLLAPRWSILVALSALALVGLTELRLTSVQEP